MLRPACVAAANMEKSASGGIKLSKQNVFDDFIAAAQWLMKTIHVDTELALARK